MQPAVTVADSLSGWWGCGVWRVCVGKGNSQRQRKLQGTGAGFAGARVWRGAGGLPGHAVNPSLEARMRHPWRMTVPSTHPRHAPTVAGAHGRRGQGVALIAPGVARLPFVQGSCRHRMGRGCLQSIKDRPYQVQGKFKSTPHPQQKASTTDAMREFRGCSVLPHAHRPIVGGWYGWGCGTVTRHGWRVRASTDGFTACPATAPVPAQTSRVKSVQLFSCSALQPSTVPSSTPGNGSTCPHASHVRSSTDA